MLQGTPTGAAQLNAREPIARLNFDPGIAAAMRRYEAALRPRR